MNSKIILVLLISASIFFLWLIVRDFPKKAEVEKQAGDIKAKLESLKKEEERLKSLADYYRSESYLEKQARLRLNLKKEGESVVFVYKRAEEQKEEPQQEENFFLSKFKNWFKFLFE